MFTSDDQVETIAMKEVELGDKIFRDGEFQEVEYVGARPSSKEIHFSHEILSKPGESEMLRLLGETYTLQGDVFIPGEDDPVDPSQASPLTRKALRTAYLFGQATFQINSSNPQDIRAAKELSKTCGAVGYRLLWLGTYEAKDMTASYHKEFPQFQDGSYLLVATPEECALGG